MLKSSGDITAPQGVPAAIDFICDLAIAILTLKVRFCNNKVPITLN